MEHRGETTNKMDWLATGNKLHSSNDDIVNRDVNKLHEESDKSHNQESESSSPCDLGEF